VVTGCAAQTTPEIFAEMPEVDLVLGNAEKLVAETYRTPDFGIDQDQKVRVNDIASVEETALHLIEGIEGR
ncbi:MAG: tRNA (N(6)-L-threonylcarbamoyladenosine(37)-C(2))-methylthiotransferase MtaB, partial [Hyphomicrobiales bacterium]|nr:tRNA (N(6)-L-threonylcarbamoyladenosine(37)-C(2))-methylthiotransferase MtaB [Hyphomicrobiales bacterium]